MTSRRGGMLLVSAPRASGLRTGGDGNSDQVSVFGPGAVIVAAVALAQKMSEYKPCVARSLPDAAVADRRQRLVHRLAPPEDRFEIFTTAEGTVGVDAARPGNVYSARDVATPLRALDKPRRSDQSTRVFILAAHIEQICRSGHRRFKDIGELGPKVRMDLADGIWPRRQMRIRAGEWLVCFAQPLVAAAVHDPHIAMAEVLHDPERVGREPVVVVTIQDDRVGLGNAQR